MYYGKYTWILCLTPRGDILLVVQKSGKFTSWNGKYHLYLQGFSTIQTVVVGDFFHQQYDLHHRKPTIDPPKTEGLVQMTSLVEQVIFRFHINFQWCATLKTNMDPPKKHGFQYMNYEYTFPGVHLKVSCCCLFFSFFRVYSCNVWMLVRMIDDPTISSRWNGRHAKSFLWWWQYVSIYVWW